LTSTRYVAGAFVVIAVFLALLVVWLGIRVVDLQRQLDAGSGPGSSPTIADDSPPDETEPASPSAGSGASSPAGSPVADVAPGRTWYPPTAPSGSLVIASARASQEERARADVVVEGSADDEINAALETVGSRDGGQVTLTAGVFELAEPITIDGDGVALVGTNVGNGAGYAESALGTMLVPADGFPNDAFLVQTTPDAYGPLLSLLHLDGLGRAQGLNVESRRPTITLNAVTQARGTGMRFAGESTGNRPYDGYVLYNRVFDGSGIGILHDSRSGDMLIEGNIVFRNEGDGMRCLGASQMYRVNHAYNNGGVGLRIIPGCVRTRLSSNKWEGNAEGGVSIEGGSGFTIVGDTFAHNEADQDDPPAQIQVGVRGEQETVGVMIWGISFGKGSDDNPNLVHVGSLGREVHLGPVHSNGGFTDEPYRVDDGGELSFYEAVPEIVIE
jgi:hypothetical protein